MIVDSKLNIFDINKQFSLYEQRENFTKAVNDPEKKITPEVLLGEYYRYSLTDKSVAAAQHRLNHTNLPLYVDPFILFSCIAHLITANSFCTIQYDSNNQQIYKHYSVLSKIGRPSEWINLKKSAPYFLLIAGKLADDKTIFFKDALLCLCINITY